MSQASAFRQARRAYEIARLRRGVVRALAFCGPLGLVSMLAIGVGALAWLPVFLVVWAVLEWRGGSLLRGGRVGGLLGAIFALAPTSLFMTCCRIGCKLASGVCCNTSRACIAIGVLVGLGVAGFLSRLPAHERSKGTIGAALGLVATAIPRCSSLMVGEAMGLVLGLVAGTLAAGLVWRIATVRAGTAESR